MAITNLTNTTWVFNDAQLTYNQDCTSKTYDINFISNNQNFVQFLYVYDDETYEDTDGDDTNEYFYYASQYGASYNEATLAVNYYTSHTSNDNITWSNTNYKTIKITGGQDVYDSKFITFLNYNATCQTTLVTVTFNMNGKGTAVSSQTFASGEKVTIPVSPTADGYLFAGWYTDSSLTTAFDFSTSVTSNITLYAKWITEDPPVFDNKNIKTKVSGTWEDCTPLVKVNNAWKDIDKLFVKVNGVWQSVITTFSGDIILPNVPEGTLLAQFYSSTGFSKKNDSNNGVFQSYQGGGYFFYRILTNDSFSFNLQIEFEAGVPNEAFYGVGITSSPTTDASLDESIIGASTINYSGTVTINIPSGNFNKYIVGFADYDPPNGYVDVGDFTFLSNYDGGFIVK